MGADLRQAFAPGISLVLALLRKNNGHSPVSSPAFFEKISHFFEFPLEAGKKSEYNKV